eukprot:12730989-Alexandrium_andersonii.AAC.1
MLTDPLRLQRGHALTLARKVLPPKLAAISTTAETKACLGKRGRPSESSWTRPLAAKRCSPRHSGTQARRHQAGRRQAGKQAGRRTGRQAGGKKAGGKKAGRQASRQAGRQEGRRARLR